MLVMRSPPRGELASQKSSADLNAKEVAMSKVRLAILVAVFSIASTGVVRAQSTAEDKAAIRKVLAEYRAAINPLDTIRLRTIHSPDVIVVDGGVLSRGRDAFLKALQADLGGNGKDWRFTSMEIAEIRFSSATTAIALTTWEGGIPGRAAQKGIWLAMLGKHGSGWWLEAWSSAAPAR
jgi:ketosteroid isomerase-like protein